MRSCALRIFEAATISIALVIFRVFCTLRIFIRISLVPGIFSSSTRAQNGLVAAVLLPVGDRVLEHLLVFGGKVVLLFHAPDQLGVLALYVVAHRLLGR